MGFRQKKNQPVLVTGMAAEETVHGGDVGAAESGRARWSTAFLMASSALLGATALAFWNRRTIVSMRAQIQAQAQSDQAAPTTVEDEEIL